MKAVKYILITLTIALFIWLLMQLINDMKQLNAQVISLHNQVKQLQEHQITLTEHNKAQDKLIEEIVFKANKPEPIKENQPNTYEELEIKEVMLTPPIPMLIGAWELLRKSIFSW